mmetsp:Transcript_37406/g.102776  ORF Transcript_37406/g.102776 Transcript_37406/m.102776 type:complete len:261 (+) Transcript_37406:466-1248(+)
MRAATCRPISGPLCDGYHCEGCATERSKHGTPSGLRRSELSHGELADVEGLWSSRGVLEHDETAPSLEVDREIDVASTCDRVAGLTIRAFISPPGVAMLNVATPSGNLASSSVSAHFASRRANFSRICSPGSRKPHSATSLALRFPRDESNGSVLWSLRVASASGRRAVKGANGGRALNWPRGVSPSVHLRLCNSFCLLRAVNIRALIRTVPGVPPTFAPVSVTSSMVAARSAAVASVVSTSPDVMSIATGSAVHEVDVQ